MMQRSRPSPARYAKGLCYVYPRQDQPVVVGRGGKCTGVIIWNQECAHMHILVGGTAYHGHGNEGDMAAFDMRLLRAKT